MEVIKYGPYPDLILLLKQKKPDPPNGVNSEEALEMMIGLLPS